MSIVPSVGVSGAFTLKAPFDSLISPNIIYTVRAIRGLQDYIAQGTDPYEKFYVTNQLAQSVYDADLNASEYIVSLQSSDGKWIYVPTSYISALPVVSGVSYTSMAMAVFLGPLPDDYSLTYLNTKVSELVESIVGVTPTIKNTAVSAKSLITQENHELTLAAREVVKSATTTEYAQLLALQNQNAELLIKVNALETHIRNNP